MLSIKLAEEIVYQTMLRLHHNINVISPDGVILASGEKERIDSVHEGAIQVAKTGMPLLIDEKHCQRYHNCKPGINLPIKFHEKIIGVIGITGNPNELQEIANLVQLTTEMMVHQVLTENKSEWQRKNGDFIFKALIDNVPIDSELTGRIQKLPFPLEGPYQILLIKHNQIELSNSLSLHLENILYKQPALYGQIDLTLYYILLYGNTVKKSDYIVDLIRNLRKKINIYLGVGPTVNRLEDLPYCFNGTKTTLTFSNDTQPVTYFQDVEIYTLFKNRNSHEVVNFLTKINGLTEKMTITLRTFFESNLQLTICADKLGIHRHTLTYRLNKIFEITGYNPQNFEDAFVLKLALECLALEQF